MALRALIYQELAFLCPFLNEATTAEAMWHGVCMRPVAVTFRGQQAYASNRLKNQ